MYKYPNFDKLLLRRTVLLGAGKFLLLSTVLSRLAYLQIFSSDKYKLLANKNRINLRLLSPIRGKIFDRHGKILAFNKNTFRISAIINDISQLNYILSEVSKIIFLDSEEIKRARDEFSKKKKFMPVLIKDNLKWNEISVVSVNLHKLPQIIVETGLQRKYPFKEVSSHAIGYVAPPSTKDIKKEPVLGLMHTHVGKFGIEEQFDTKLRGTPGTKHLEVNAFGRVMREISRENSQPGKDVKLSIDIKLQEYLHSLLQDRSGSIVAVNVQNDEIIGMVSSPSFDSNIFNVGLKETEWQELTRDPLSPLLNKAIAGEYSPGSTFKILVLLAALKNKIIKKKSLIHCKSKFDFGDRTFYCWCHKKKTGCWANENNERNVGPKLALAQSCDGFFYELAKRIGIDNIAKTALEFGMGDKTGINIKGEKKGLVPNRSWKKKNHGKSWQIGETMITGVGQGYITATPLQLALLVGVVANNGKKIYPRINLDNLNSRINDLNLDYDDYQEYFSVVKEGMFNAVNKPYGTAYRSRLSKIIYAGKTGTVQVRKITQEERDTEIIPNSKLPYKQRDHSLFIGFAPYDKPKIAISVIVEHAGSGSKIAAPIAKKIFKKII